MSTNLILARYPYRPAQSWGELARPVLIAMVAFVAAAILLVALFTPRADRQVLAPQPTSPPAVIEKLIEPVAEPQVVAPEASPSIGGSTHPQSSE